MIHTHRQVKPSKMHAFSHLPWGCVFVEKPISLAKVHVPHAMIHLCRVDHCQGVLMPLKLRLDHFVSLFNLYFNKYLLMTLYTWKKVKVSLSLPWIYPKNFQIPTIFNLKQVAKLAVKSHLPGGLQDDISTTLGRVLRYTHGVAQDGFRSAHGEIQGRHWASKEPLRGRVVMATPKPIPKPYQSICPALLWDISFLCQEVG